MKNRLLVKTSTVSLSAIRLARKWYSRHCLGVALLFCLDSRQSARHVTHLRPICLAFGTPRLLFGKEHHVVLFNRHSLDFGAALTTGTNYFYFCNWHLNVTLTGL
jgi:hypothetical protein